jgi:hypothetical protein
MALDLAIAESAVRLRLSALDIVQSSARPLIILGGAAIFAATVPIYAEELKIRKLDNPAPGNVVVRLDVPGDVSPQPADVALKLDGEAPVRATSVKTIARPQGPQVVAVCVDRSGSMGRAAVEEARQALIQILQRSDPRLDFAIIEFGSKTQTLAAFGSDRNEATEKVGQLTLEPGDGKTKLYEALAGALDQLRARGASASASRLVVISDGKDEGSRVGAERVVDKAREAGIAINGIGVGRFAQQTGSSLESLSASTRGLYTLIEPGSPGLTKAIEQAVAHGGQAPHTLDVSFEYPASDRMASAAVLEVNRPSGAPLQERIQAQLASPAPAIPPKPLPKPDKAPWYREHMLELSIGLGALLALLLLLFILMRRRKPEPERVVYSPPAPPPPPPRDEPPRPPRARKTMINRHVFTQPAPNHPTAVLYGISGPSGGRDFAIDKVLFRIGANATNDMRLGNDDWVSGEHAHIKFDSGSLYLADRQSRNGTFLNGTRLKDATMPLAPGDEIRFGESTFELRPPPGNVGRPPVRPEAAPGDEQWTR